MEDYLRSVTTKDFATKPKALPTGQPNSSKEKLKLKLMNGGDIRLMNVKVMCARVECANRRRSGGGFLPDAARRWLRCHLSSNVLRKESEGWRMSKFENVEQDVANRGRI